LVFKALDPDPDRYSAYNAGSGSKNFGFTLFFVIFLKLVNFSPIGRGSLHRGAAWEAWLRGRLGQVELADQVIYIQFLLVFRITNLRVFLLLDIRNFTVKFFLSCESLLSPLVTLKGKTSFTARRSYTHCMF
jgi:hypothetical protein